MSPPVQHLTLAGLAAVHSEVCGLISLESRLFHSRPVDLDFVRVRALANQHLLNTHTAHLRPNATNCTRNASASIPLKV